MDIQNSDNQLTDGEKRLFLLGAIVFAGLLLATIIFGSFVSPFTLLLLRLSILSTCFIYYLAIYLYYVKYLKGKQDIIEENKYEIIIWFNGKELGRL
jgi:hypothetical protein